MEKIISHPKFSNLLSVKMSQIIVICCILIFPAFSSYAMDDIDLKGFYAGIIMGYGNIHSSANSNNKSSGSFALDLQGGWAITSRTILGLEFNSYLIHGYSGGTAENWYYPDQGESIDNLSLFITTFPFKKRPVYFSGGIGKGAFRKINGDDEFEDRGNSWFLGCGYEFHITKNLVYAPQLKYSQYNLSGNKYKASEISIALRWYPKW
jgi:hypothetical protein